MILFSTNALFIYIYIYIFIYIYLIYIYINVFIFTMVRRFVERVELFVLQLLTFLYTVYLYLFCSPAPRCALQGRCGHRLLDGPRYRHRAVIVRYPGFARTHGWIPCQTPSGWLGVPPRARSLGLAEAGAGVGSAPAPLRGAGPSVPVPSAAGLAAASRGRP